MRPVPLQEELGIQNKVGEQVQFLLKTPGGQTGPKNSRTAAEKGDAEE